MAACRDVREGRSGTAVAMKESDIHPASLFAEHLAIARDDITRFFSDKPLFADVPCSACQSADAKDAFEKHGINYRLRRGCGSLYVLPRPTRQTSWRSSPVTPLPMSAGSTASRSSRAGFGHHAVESAGLGGHLVRGSGTPLCS